MIPTKQQSLSREAGAEHGDNVPYCLYRSAHNPLKENKRQKNMKWKPMHRILHTQVRINTTKEARNTTLKTGTSG